MNVWIVTGYEPLPLNDPKTRPQRSGMLAKVLLSRGHTVELWTSTFEHVQHVHHRRGSALVRIGSEISIQFIEGCGYVHDRSPKRFLHNHQTKREFSRIAADRSILPDIIFTSVPTLELSDVAVRFAISRNIPIIVDVRDLWPDIYYEMFPDWTRFLVRCALIWEYRRVWKIFSRATGITAISKTYLDWGLSHAKRAARETDSVFHLGFLSDSFASLKISSTKSSRIRYGIDPDDFVVTFVGTLSGFNSLESVMETARLLQDEKKLRFLIVGDGEYKDRLEKSVRDLPNVRMLGWLDFIAIKEVLCFTKVGLISYGKGAPMSLPNKPFEYMAAGLPLLSSLPGELERLIRENKIGRIYAENDPASLAKEIMWFLGNKEQTEEMGRRSKDLFIEKFRSESIYLNLVNHLENVANK